VLDRVVEKLRNEFVHHGRPEHFRTVEVFLLGAVRRALCRTGSRNEHLRGSAQSGHSQAPQAVSRPLRQEIADTVADPAEVESELRFLAAVLNQEVAAGRPQSV